MNIHDFQMAFESAADPARAEQMSAYLKGQFPFFGLQAGERRTLQNEIFKREKTGNAPLDMNFVKACWKADQREFQYLAIDYLRRKEKMLAPDHLPMLVDLILAKSWWDTVDSLAAAPIGAILMGNEVLIRQYPDQWIESENFWLRRTALLYQLKYKDHIDYDRLSRYCRSQEDEKEFFIRKAMGWILREASKTNPDQVKAILAAGNYSGLTVREASKYLGKK